MVGDLRDEASVAIRDALENRTYGVRSGTTGPGSGSLHLAVMGADEPVARELHERFGELIAITVAGHRYPFDSSVSVVFAPPGAPNAGHFGIEATTVLDPPFRKGVVTGSIITGTVKIHNVSRCPIEWHLGSGVGTGDLCRADERPYVVANVRNGRSRGGGRGISLEPNESCRAPFLASTDSRDPREGAVLPPAAYQLYVVFSVANAHAGSELICPPTVVHVIART